MATAISRWRTAWLCLACALGLHVADEARTGFLPVYNGIVQDLRAGHPWLLLPTFTFPIWLGGLVAGIALLFALTPVVARGARWIRFASLILGTLMIGNALGHLGASIYWGRLAPGASSSPFLMVASAAVVITAWRAGPALRRSA